METDDGHATLKETLGLWLSEGLSMQIEQSLGLL